MEIPGREGREGMHPFKSAKRSTFNHKIGQKWSFCRGWSSGNPILGSRRSTFLGPASPPVSILAMDMGDTPLFYWNISMHFLPTEVKEQKHQSNMEKTINTLYLILSIDSPQSRCWTLTCHTPTCCVLKKRGKGLQQGSFFRAYFTDKAPGLSGGNNSPLNHRWWISWTWTLSKLSSK